MSRRPRRSTRTDTLLPHTTRVRSVLEEARTARLIEATRFLRQVQEARGLTVGPAFDADTLTPTLQAALTAIVGLHSFAALRARLEETLTWAHGVYVEVIDAPAPAAGETAAKDELPRARGA